MRTHTVAVAYVAYPYQKGLDLTQLVNAFTTRKAITTNPSSQARNRTESRVVKDHSEDKGTSQMQKIRTPKCRSRVTTRNRGHTSTSLLWRKLSLHNSRFGFK